MIPEETDLHALAEELRVTVGTLPPEGYLRGKSVMRDILVSHKGVSELEAEELIDTMELNGYLKFLGNPTERSHAHSQWEIEPDASKT